MTKRALIVAGIATGAAIAAATALAQSPGVGDSAPPSTQEQGPRGTGPGMMQNMERGMGPCMGPGMMQRMGSGMMHHMAAGMMHGGMLQGGFDLTQIDPARLATLKTELGITPAEETAWTKYSDVLRETAATVNSTREATKTAANELLGALDGAQKAKARELLPGLASSGLGMMGGMTTGDRPQPH